MMRNKLIVGNWKMYKTVAESVAMAKELKAKLGSQDKTWMAVAPVFTSISAVAAELKGTKIDVSAQNCHWEKEGAFTGEVSPAMLKEAGATSVIIAHSERRQYFGETNETANKKVKACLAEGLGVILCVGEKLDEREAGRTFDVVKNHVLGSLDGVTPEQMKMVIVAYEPVWAIGTGKTASPAQAQEVHAFIRGLFKERFGSGTSENGMILYGGSVKPENVAELMGQPDIDGALVGGASLKADSFEKLVKF
jgi:triosephosphate isomerase